MSINKLSHLKEGEKIYIPLERILHLRDDTDGLCFHDVNGCTYWVTDDDTFYTLDDLKQLANDGVPKQGEMIEARYKTECGVLSNWFLVKFVCSYEGRLLVDNGMKILKYDEWRYKKTELTLAEVEERLGYEEGTLEITN